MKLVRLILAIGCLVVIGIPIEAQSQSGTTVSVGEAEVQRCDDRIASVQREILNRYETALQELQSTFQKAADLEASLAVRAERQRASKEGSLTENALVNEPRALRTLQTQMLAKLQELTMQIVQETLPRLIEQKKTLTIAGKLDEAVAVRSAIERLQNEYLPLVKPDPTVATPVDILLQAYSADRARADKVYKGNRVAVRGVFGGFRVDPNDSRQFQLFLGGNSGSWVQCGFSGNEFRFREEKQFNNSFLVIIPKDNENGALRVQRGQTIDVRGTCDGWEDGVRLSRCELFR